MSLIQKGRLLSGQARIPSKKAIVQVTWETDILDTHYLRVTRGTRSPNLQAAFTRAKQVRHVYRQLRLDVHEIETECAERNLIKLV